MTEHIVQPHVQEDTLGQSVGIPSGHFVIWGHSVMFQVNRTYFTKLRISLRSACAQLKGHAQV